MSHRAWRWSGRVVFVFASCVVWNECAEEDPMAVEKGGWLEKLGTGGLFGKKRSKFFFQLTDTFFVYHEREPSASKVGLDCPVVAKTTGDFHDDVR